LVEVAQPIALSNGNTDIRQLEYIHIQSAWGWSHISTVNSGYFDSDDSNIAAAGWTDSKNPRGSGLVYTAVPTINTPRHFTFRQPVTLVSGNNVVYMNGGSSDGGAVPFLTDCTQLSLADTIVAGTNPPAATLRGFPAVACGPIEVLITTGGVVGTAKFTWTLNSITQATNVATASSVVLGSTGISINFPDGTYGTNNTYTAYTNWANAQYSLKCDLEFASVSDLTSADCYIVGYNFVTESVGPPILRNAVCKIKNPGGTTPTVNLVWTYDVFVTNYPAGSGIG
jgi:hypothetical protein